VIYAVYRCLYGEDFIRQSVESIIDSVDKVIFFLDEKVWGDADHCIYRGQYIEFPRFFDRAHEIVKEMAAENPKIVVRYDHVYNNVNQFTHLVNDRILGDGFERPDEIMVVEIDHVFRPDQLALALQMFRDRGFPCATTRQIEVWRGGRYRVPERPNRVGVVFWNMRHYPKMPPTLRQADLPSMPILDACVHNLGFACSREVMYWKHMTGLGIAQAIADNRPNEDWYEKKWLRWTPGMRDLEIASGFEHLIPELLPYDPAELPQAIRQQVENYVLHAEKGPHAA
jgi:hypothetical protein